MKQIANSSQMAWVDLTLVSVCAGLWFARPELGWRLLPVILLPWVGRLVGGVLPFRRTPVDVAVFLFLVTAVVGMSGIAPLGYAPALAWAKFWQLVAAVRLYYAVAGLPARQWHSLFRLLVLGGLCGLAYYLFSADWQLNEVRLALFNDWGRAWMQVRPNWGLPPLHPNVLASVLAMSGPLILALARFEWKRRAWGWWGGTAVAAILVLAGLVFTTSRGAVISLVVAVGLWGWWLLSQRLGQTGVERVASRRPGIIFVAGLLLGVGLILVLSRGQFGRLLPGDMGNRWELAGNTLALIRDFYLTGSGLGTFAALYAQYIWVVPFRYLEHGHNLWLDVALEQGVVGVVAVTVVLGGSLCRLWGHPSAAETADPVVRWGRWGTLSSLVVMLLHGLMDDPLYGQLGTPFLLLLPGVAMMLTPPSATAVSQHRRHWVWGGAVLLVACLLVGGWWAPLQGQWWATQGALAMARVELRGWPHNVWDDGRNVAALDAVRGYFDQALAIDPDNVTAHYRLGLIAMLHRDYDMAVAHLQSAHQSDPTHRGLIKNLGYSFVWQGDFVAAAALLAQIPEAERELEAYTGWWRTQQRPDLAQNAREMMAHLENSRP